MTEMELLDQFAIAALQGSLTNEDDLEYNCEEMAQACYLTAIIAMVEERKKVLKKCWINELTPAIHSQL